MILNIVIESAFILAVGSGQRATRQFLFARACSAPDRYSLLSRLVAINLPLAGSRWLKTAARRLRPLPLEATVSTISHCSAPNASTRVAKVSSRFRFSLASSSSTQSTQRPCQAYCTAVRSLICAEMCSVLVTGIRLFPCQRRWTKQRSAFRRV